MKTILHNIFFTFALVLMAFGTMAQPHTVTGVIKDGTNGQTIPGATVLEKGTSNGTVTDLDGKYKITVASKNSTLQISFMGYQKVEIAIAGQSEVDLIMTPDQQVLDELVVIGYGVQKKKVVTGAIATVKPDEIAKLPTLRMEQALQGRAAGVQVTSLSGQPGEPFTVIIRGTGSTRNSAPLYVVDGMVVGNIQYLNPGDIESIDVLKDAASAAIYGAAAANGVILVTTKNGAVGKMNLTYSAYYGVQNAAKKIKMLDANQYRMLMNEGARNSNLTEPFDLNEIPRHSTNWQDYIFEKNAPITNHELTMTGGTEKSNYATSISYFSQDGIVGGDKSHFERYTARAKSNHQVTSFFNFGSNLAYTHTLQRGIASNSSFNGVLSSALNLDPLTPVYEDDPSVLSLYPYSSEPVVVDASGRVYGISDYVGAEIVNPLALLELQNQKYRTDRVNGSVFGELKPIEGLVAKSSLGVDLTYVIDDSFRPLFYLNGAQYNTEKTSVSKSIGRNFRWQWDNTISYSKKIENHNFSLLGGTSSIEGKSENLYGFNAKVPVNNPDHVYLDMATDTVWKAGGGAGHEAQFSLFGRVTYDYMGRYSFTGIFRRDGSSKFGKNRRYGNFPSVGFSWVVTDEPFMPEMPRISFIKLRTSWGKNGNQEIGDYQFVSSMNQTRRYIFGSGSVIGASPSFVPNEDIHWEESEMLNIAIDLGAFENRFTATIDYYIKTTHDLLERVPIPAHVGNDPPYANIGSVQNRGVEVSLKWKHKYNDFNYAVGLNAGYNHNEMIKVMSDIGGASWAVAGRITRADEGLPIAYFWGYRTAGLFQNWSDVYRHINSSGELLQPRAQPGDVRFVDVNGDGIIDANDRTMIGNPTPKWTLGFDFNTDYKNFDLSILFVGAFGHDVFNGTIRRDLRYTNQPESILDRWTGEGTSNEIPRFAWIDVNNNYRVSDLDIEDGSYLKLKNIQLGYTLPKGLLSKFKTSVWRFYVSAENLLTITKYSGLDPEIGAMGALDIGIDRALYPQARSFRVGTSITF